MGGSTMPRSEPARAGSVASSCEAAELLRRLEAVALGAVRAAAVASARWNGRGDGMAADGAATTAMRDALGSHVPRGTVVTGEGAKDEAPMLAPGEQLGGSGPGYDVAVDPLECTGLCAAGLPGALATIAMAGPGTLFSPGPAHYMDKLVVGAVARDAIDLAAGPVANTKAIARALGRPLAELRVVVLDKPRHAGLVRLLRAEGVRVATPPAGDVAGALAALLEDGEADVLMGVGGAPEGVMTACAVRALGGGMQARLAPQRDDENRALAASGVDARAILTLDDLAAGPALFAAAGISSGLLPAARREGDRVRVHTLLVADGAVARASVLVPVVFTEES